MKRYQLAKLVEWADTLESRKRMQKIVFMLKVKGCSLDADFILHRFGPYSSDVARLTDEMVRCGLLDEYETDIGMGRVKYEYQLSSQGKEQLQGMESSGIQAETLQELEQYKTLTKKLLDADLWKLEVASTVVFFRDQGHNWEDSKTEAFQFKNVDSHSEFAEEVEELARTILD